MPKTRRILLTVAQVAVMPGPPDDYGVRVTPALRPYLNVEGTARGLKRLQRAYERAAGNAATLLSFRGMALTCDRAAAKIEAALEEIRQGRRRERFYLRAVRQEEREFAERVRRLEGETGCAESTSGVVSTPL